MTSIRSGRRQRSLRQRSLQQRSLLIVFLLGMTFSNGLVALKLLPLLRNGYQDFTIFYGAARMVRSGQAHSLYDLPAQYRAQQEFAPNVSIRQAPLPYNHPPFEAVLFVPFTFLSYWPAYVLWSALNLLLLAGSLILLRSQFSSLAAIPPFIFGLSALAFFPVAIGLIQGQDVILLLFLFILTIVCLNRGREVTAGALLAGGLFRPQLAVPLLILFTIRRWRVLIGFAPIALILAGVSVAMTGWRGPYDYVRFVLHLEGTGARAFGSEAVPNVRGLVQNLPGLSTSAAAMLILLLSLAVFGAAALRILRRRDSILFASSLAAVATILVSFHSLVYDLSLLLPLLFLMLSDVLRTSDDRNETPTTPLALPLLLILLLSPFYIFLLFYADRFFWFSLVLLSLFLAMLPRPDSKSLPSA